MKGHATARNRAETAKTRSSTKAVRKLLAEMLGLSTSALCPVPEQVARKFCASFQQAGTRIAIWGVMISYPATLGHPPVTSFVEKLGKKSLRKCLIEWIGGASVPTTSFLTIIVLSAASAVSTNAATSESLSFKTQSVFGKRNSDSDSTPSKAEKSGKSEFTFKDKSGKTVSVPVIEQYQKDRIVRPVAKVDPHLDPRLSRAASIADERAHAHSKSRCWHYVKEALLASGAVNSYPKTALAKQAGDELVRDYGFKKLPISDPYAAPIGSVLVYYKGRHKPGHVEIRTKTGFVSDFRSKEACKSALVGVYAKK